MSSRRRDTDTAGRGPAAETAAPEEGLADADTLAACLVMADSLAVPGCDPDAIVSSMICALSAGRGDPRRRFPDQAALFPFGVPPIRDLRNRIAGEHPRVYRPAGSEWTECADMDPEVRFRLARRAAGDPVFLDAARALRHDAFPWVRAFLAVCAVFAGDDTLFPEGAPGEDILYASPYWLHCAATREWYEARTARGKRFVVCCALMNLAERGAVSPLLEAGLHRGMALPPPMSVIADVLDGRAARPKPAKSRMDQRLVLLLHDATRGERTPDGNLAEDCLRLRGELVRHRIPAFQSPARARAVAFTLLLVLFLRGVPETEDVFRRLLDDEMRAERWIRDVSATGGMPGIHALKALDCLRRHEDGEAARQVLELPGEEDRNVLSALLFHGARARLGLAGEADRAAVAGWYGRLARLPVYAHMAYGLLRAMDPEGCPPAPAPLPAGAGCLDIMGLVPDVPRWEECLQALERRPPADAPPAARMVWEVNCDNDRILLYEQKRLARGGWSQGRRVSLDALTPWAARDLPFEDADLAVLGALFRGGSLHGCVELKEVAGSLVGHPRVMERQGNRLVPVSVERGRVELRVRQRPGGFVICLADEGLAALLAQRRPLPENVITRADGGGLVVYTLGRGERETLGRLRDGIEFPAVALNRVLSAVRDSAGIRVSVDIEAETVDCDGTVVFQLEQTGRQFEAVLGVRPFGRPGTPFFPLADGSAEPVITMPAAQAADAAAEGDGASRPGEGCRPLRARRDFDAERAALSGLVAACPALAANLEGRHWVSGDVEEVLSLLDELEDSGLPFSVEWPRGQRVRIARRLGAEGVSARIGRARSSGIDWFAVSGGIPLPGERILSLRTLIASFRGSRFVSLGDGEYLALTRELRGRISRLRTVLAERRGELLVSPLHAEAVEGALEGMDVEAVPEWTASVGRMREAFAATPEVPPLLRATLRDYQREGYTWLQRLANWGVGACLADDMGLGKTVQAIAVMLNQARKGPCLVLAPTSVCGNWEQELARFAPSLAVRRFGTPRGRAALVAELGAGDVLVAGYGLLPHVENVLAGREWAMVVFDEAQALKNAATRRARAGRRIRGGFLLALTGTPIENRIDDLWSLFSVINPGLLGSWSGFRARFGAAAPGTGESRALRAIVRPFLLRRLKSAVLDELPPRTEQTVIVEPCEKELVFYESLRASIVEDLESGSGDRRFRILAGLTRLRRACCHPALADPDMAAMEEESSKTLRFVEIVRDLAAGGHRVLAFSQFTSYLALVRRALETRGIGCQYLDGSTPEAERRARLADFQKGRGDVFLLSLKAGGTGINLTAADYVVHLDPWWNPAVEDQASDRAHRIGQRRPVTVYRLAMARTVEEKILALHGSKRELAAEFLAGTDTGVRNLTEEELLALLR